MNGQCLDLSVSDRNRSNTFVIKLMVAWEHPNTAGIPVFPDRKDKGTVGIPGLPAQG